ncbi:hypothetical protein G9A89_018218 [Geosiphon pyriformis]|nr:hypothetical protein G9A89_018218 [Geosiphon pyriformis]
MPLNRIPFQSKQKKAELLGTYNFRAISPWEITDSKEEESSNQEVNKQNPIIEHSEIKTLVNQTSENQNNQNSDIINQHLPPVIVINPSPVLPNTQQQQQPQLLPQQQIQQQLQPNLDSMAYVPIVKLEKFTGEEDNAQNTANSWYQSLINKPQDFNTFKIEFLRYFSNNNSINRLANTFTTIKQGENEAVTTYLRCFHKNLCQIQAINANYFIVAQILNQFICGLCSSILQCICLLHVINLQAAITNARDFEAAELKANHAQAINLVMNRLSELDSKLKQFTAVTTHLSAAVSDNLSASTNSNTATELTSKQNPRAKIDPTKLEIIDENTQPNNLETNQQPTLTSNIPPAIITENKSLDAIFPFKLEELLTTPLFSGAALKEKPITVMYTDAKVDGHFIKLILNSGLAGSIITKQLIDQLSRQVDCAANTRIITTNKATKTPIGKIDDFSIKVNDIMVPIKVLVMEATQYQALVGNDWLSKTNALFD